LRLYYREKQIAAFSVTGNGIKMYGQNAEIFNVEAFVGLVTVFEELEIIITTVLNEPLCANLRTP